MKISVALATYNGEKFIIEQLESILRQTQAVDEVVICDDRSQDGTVPLIEEFIAQNSLGDRWRLFVNERNLGYCENFKKAAYLCTGDVVFFCDQDDIWVQNRIEVMAAVMRENLNISVLTSRLLWFSDEEKKTRLLQRPLSSGHKLKSVPFHKKNGYLRAFGCVMCVRGDFLKKIEPNWYLGWAQDEACWCLSIACGELYELTDYVSLYRRDHAQRTSGRLGHQKGKRLKYLRDLQVCASHMVSLAMKESYDEKVLRFNYHCYLMAKKREAFLLRHSLFGAIGLLRYLSYYYSKKSYFIELLMN